ncbi:MAG TPA: efflux RND transporter periplasmic adaptor subunit, partial [Verrucomicrobiae bacterium]|nr:efflux RND transporter periplasmic adaptor subunit [Verrucomicrobiae bacterium]
QEKEVFRPGMSVTAEIETRYRTNVLSVPIQSVTTRLPKPPGGGKGGPGGPGPGDDGPKPGELARPDGPVSAKKKDETPKVSEVVFVRDNDHVKMKKVKTGISDEEHIEILEGLAEGEEVVSGGYKAISRELEDGKLIKIGPPKGAGPGPAAEEKK